MDLYEQAKGYSLVVSETSGDYALTKFGVFTHTNGNWRIFGPRVDSPWGVGRIHASGSFDELPDEIGKVAAKGSPHCCSTAKIHVQRLEGWIEDNNRAKFNTWL